MPIHWGLNEEQSLLRGSVGRLLADTYDMPRRRAAIATEPGWRREVWRAFADLGLLALPFAEANGGLGGGALELGVVMEAFGRALVVEPYIQTVVVCGGLLDRHGSDAQKARRLTAIAAGELICAAAFGEPQSRHNLANVRTTARAESSGYVLDGAKAMVTAGPWADLFVVSARTAGRPTDADGISLFLVPADAAGLVRRDVRTFDGQRASELTLAGVRVGAEALVGELGGGLALAAEAFDRGALALMAENVGAMERLNEIALEHLHTRHAFGQPLASFQVLQHRMVDMVIAHEAAAMAVLMATVDADRDPAKTARLVSAARALITAETRFVGQNAVHLHGAIGISEELDVGQYFKRLSCAEQMFGDAAHHLARYARLARPESGGRFVLDDYVLPLAPDDAAFRDQIRATLTAEVDAELKEARRKSLWWYPGEFKFSQRWQKRLNDFGWGAPHWPVEYGGQPWTPVQQMIFDRELAIAGAPVPSSQIGRDLAAPVIMHYASPELKAEILPRILSGEDWWAQGYSEPGSGSDLAAASLSAVSDGDDYVLNGSKIWTTRAHDATHIFLLARTARGEKKQFGLTFLLVDLKTPGVEVRPIINIAGEHDYNQVFFTDVRAPTSRRLGEENNGWSVARHLLTFEHALAGNSAAELLWRFGWLQDLTMEEPDGSDGAMAEDPAFSRALAQAACELQRALFAAEWGAIQRQRGEVYGGLGLLGMRFRELQQRITELAIDAVGPYAAAVQPGAMKVGVAPQVGTALGVTAMAYYLSQRGQTIAGGTPEIYRNNLSRSLLKM